VVTAAAAVHTTGINWESIAVIAGVIVAALGFITNRQEKRSTSIETAITTAVRNLAIVLEAKLETKEVVSNLRERIVRLEVESDKARGTSPEYHVAVDGGRHADG
jgi:hypothetical protein